ncbi:MAG: hypothetical protein IKM61_10330 [Eubacteriaceae bacterium]|nr:hypothetical protein [Eubacteriaceae bacterium]
MSDNLIIQILQNSFSAWNEKFREITQIVTLSPDEFRGGRVWQVITDINGALQAVGTALLVLFFLMGVMKTCGSLADIKRPEQALRIFIRFAVAKGVVTYGMDIFTALTDMTRGIISRILSESALTAGTEYALPAEIITLVEELSFFESIPLWFISLTGSLIIWVLSVVMIISVYGRFFRLYLYTAIAPIPLSALAGEPTANIGKTFIKSYAGVCMEGVIIIIACIIFSAYAASPPSPDITLSAAAMVWKYLGEIIFHMLILVGTVKLSDRVVKEVMTL